MDGIAMSELGFETTPSFCTCAQSIAKSHGGTGDHVKLLKVEVAGSVFATVDKVEDRSGDTKFATWTITSGNIGK